MDCPGVCGRRFAKAIAKKLNAENVAGPRGGSWGPSTIHGHAGRGTGILNNELYIGRLVWNRQHYVKDPDTGKRLVRINPVEAWVITDVPDLRVVAHSRGTCTNRRGIKRQEVEARVLRAIRERFFEPGAFAAFCEGFTAELTAQRREHVAQRAPARAGK